MTTSPRHLLLTGVPGVGKTTVIRRVAEGLTGMRPGGFYTEEIREAGTRRGFRLVDFEGREQVIAHVDLAGPRRVGRYGVDVAAIDAAADALLALDPAPDVYLVDEIGKMECHSARFIAVMRRLLAGEATVIATVGKGGGGFMAEVRQRDDCLLWEITGANRDAMPQEVLRWLGERGRPG
jgi:nucleoside-triphosphatase